MRIRGLSAIQAFAAQMVHAYWKISAPRRRFVTKRGRFQPGRSVLMIHSGRHYHATKGWRGGPVYGSKGMPHVY